MVVVIEILNLLTHFLIKILYKKGFPVFMLESLESLINQLAMHRGN
jgi:hypothetical protein